MISRYSPLVLCSSKRQYPGSKMARVLNWRNGWGFKIPLGCRILMDGASSTVGESFVKFWPKLLPLWCKSAVLLVQVPFWCKQQQQSGARVVLPPHRRAAVVEAGKVWSKRRRPPAWLLTGETCSTTLSLPPALCPYGSLSASFTTSPSSSFSFSPSSFSKLTSYNLSSSPCPPLEDLHKDTLSSLMALFVHYSLCLL